MVDGSAKPTGVRREWEGEGRVVGLGVFVCGAVCVAVECWPQKC